MPSEPDVELAPADSTAAASTAAAPPCISADGEILHVGSRVQTQFTRARGGDDSWYAGTVLALQPSSGRASIIYDDGEEWTGQLREIWTLQVRDEAESGEPSASRAEPTPQLIPLPPTSSSASCRGR